MMIPREQLINIDPLQPYLVFFSAKWCGTCRGVKRSLLKYLETESFPIVWIDIDEHLTLSKQLEVLGVPVIMLIKNDVEIARRSGSTTYDELLIWLAEVR